jgi:hypothetical protein
LSDLHSLGIDLFLHQQGLDTTTPSGKAMFQMLGVFAEFERACNGKATSICQMSTKSTKAPSPTVAERMRLSRERRRNGLWCVPVLLHEAEIDSLILKGFLKPELRHSRTALETAIGRFICLELGVYES